jgi:two-component system response regulator HydG
VLNQKYALDGCTPPVVQLRDYIFKVAQSRAAVLISGETGTGKERVARAVHELSPRRGHPFVPVNCAALPETLVESELFGHQRGAFTGAIATVPGKIMEAEKGTLFLDEIGEMSQAAQAKLLRVLESGELQPLGAVRARTVDVRVVAATNQDLEGLVAVKSFRIDLFYRLNVARLVVPPLRERREDIPLLLNEIVSRLNARDGRRVGSPDPELMECLLAHDWPGNVRELSNLAEVIFIDPPEGPIGLRHLPPVFRSMFARYRTTMPAERERLLRVLAHTNWNKSEAAKTLNCSRMTIYRKLAKYHIATPSDYNVNP